LKVNTPTATPTGAVAGVRPLPDTNIGGDIIHEGKPIVAAIVYAPSVVDVALTDKNGLFAFFDVPPGAPVILKIRATQLIDSGFDITANTGTFYELKAQALRNYNPRACPEKDRLRNLYVSALRIRDTYRLAIKDHRKLRLESKKTNKLTSERSLRRAYYPAQRYLLLSSLLPDRELRCRAPVPSCTRVDLRTIVRTMKMSARYLRLESLLLNRRLRFENLRSEKESNRLVRRIRRNDSRAMSLIKQLATSTYECGDS
jgi:hypothetical protein